VLFMPAKQSLLATCSTSPASGDDAGGDEVADCRDGGSWRAKGFAVRSFPFSGEIGASLCH
jgi:hypothetical protein